MKGKFVRFFIASVFILLSISNSFAQCAICTKTASQLGDKPAQGLNYAIIYLMFTPLLIMGYLGYRWFKSNGQES